MKHLFDVPGLKYVIVLGGLIGVVWIGYAVALLVATPGLAQPGQFGDSFGVLNALFAGLGLIAVAAALLLQSNELKHQREDSEAARLANEAVRQTERQRAAIDLIQHYFSEEMRKHRRDTWDYFIADPNVSEGDKADRRRRWYRFLFDSQVRRTAELDFQNPAQSAAAVLDFFVMVNNCLIAKTVDPSMVRSQLVYYYRWWREEFIIPLRQMEDHLALGSAYQPGWWKPLIALDNLCEDFP
jgi:hypothetical protein